MRMMEIGIGIEADSPRKKEVLNHNLYQTLPSLNSLADLNKSNTNIIIYLIRYVLVTVQFSLIVGPMSFNQAIEWKVVGSQI